MSKGPYVSFDILFLFLWYQPIEHYFLPILSASVVHGPDSSSLWLTGGRVLFSGVGQVPWAPSAVVPEGHNGEMVVVVGG